MEKTNREDESEEKAFYSEMDKKTIRRSCCTCKSMAILFGIIFIIVTGITVYVVKAIKQIQISEKFVKPSISAKNSFQEKLKLEPLSNPTFTVTFSSEELTSVLGEITAGSFTIKDTQIIIEENGINIFGTIISPVKTEIKIASIPQIEDGKIKIEVGNFTAGKLSLPQIFKNQIERSTNALLDKNFAPLYENYQVEDIKLTKDLMIVTGKIK